MANVVLVLTTVPEDFDAAQLARTLVDAGHAACVSLLPPMESVYRWQGAIESAQERQILIKTSTDCTGALQAALKALHPYDVPEFLVVPVIGGSPEYLAWVLGATAV